jgi:pimeloyl-ACP methyl ester carboxylesterase
MTLPTLPPVQFVNTPLLRMAYHEWNPGAPRTVVLVHGWPDSPRTWLQVAPVLAQAGWRVLAPSVRGFGETRFLEAHTPRTGQLSAVGRDTLDFIAALGLHQPALVGHDWGARAVAIACGLQPGVASHMAMLSVGYATNALGPDMSLAQAHNYWYHWFMATPVGEQVLRRQPRDFARKMWELWAPPGWYDEAEFEATAQAFDNPDWIDITLHSYRQRWGHAPGDPAYAADDARLSPAPVLAVPTLVIHGQADGVNHADLSAGKERYFTGRYARTVLPGIGHFPQREAPRVVGEALAAFLASAS